MRAALTLLGEYTAQQWGLVTAAQAASVGVDSVSLYRLKEAGFLEQTRRGVYAATAAPESLFREEQAVWLSLNPAVPAWQRPKCDLDGGVLSHESAARLHEIGDMRAAVVTVTVPRRRALRDRSVRVRRKQLGEGEVTLVDGVPTTTPLRTVLDLLADHVDASHVGQVIRQGVEAGMLEMDVVAEHIGGYAHRYGIGRRDGSRLLDHLLRHSGTSVAELARRPTRTRRGRAAQDDPLART